MFLYHLFLCFCFFPWNYYLYFFPLLPISQYPNLDPDVSYLFSITKQIPKWRKQTCCLWLCWVWESCWQKVSPSIHSWVSSCFFSEVRKHIAWSVGMPEAHARNDHLSLCTSLTPQAMTPVHLLLFPLNNSCRFLGKMPTMMTTSPPSHPHPLKKSNNPQKQLKPTTALPPKPQTKQPLSVSKAQFLVAGPQIFFASNLLCQSNSGITRSA